MDAFELLVESLKKWIKETTERIPAAQPSLNTEELKKPLEDTLVSLCRSEIWLRVIRYLLLILKYRFKV